MRRRPWIELICALVALPVIGVLLGMALHDPVTAVARTFVDGLGLGGVFAGVLIVDSFPFLIDEPILLMGVTGGLGFWTVGAVGAAASVLAGPAGWAIGRAFGKAAWVEGLFRRYRIDAFMLQHGAKAVAVAAITPFPFSLTTWCCGATGVSVGRVLLGSLLRIPKVFVYLWLILLGWTAA